MSLSDQKLKGFTKLISSLADQPRMQPQDLKAYFDSSPEEVRQAHNNLCDALCAPDAAASLGFARTAGVPADTVQAAVEHVQAQVSDAVSGNLPSGSVTGDKLAQDVRDRLSAIESAAASEASTRQSTDSSLQSQISSLSLGKSEVMVGTYVGDSQPVRLISLGRKPKAVYLCHSMADWHWMVIPQDRRKRLSPLLSIRDFKFTLPAEASITSCRILRILHFIISHGCKKSPLGKSQGAFSFDVHKEPITD